MVYRIWRGLDPILMNAIQLSHRDNSFSNFTLTLYHQEYPAHLLWRTQNRQKEARRYDSTAHASPFRPSMFQGQRPPERARNSDTKPPNTQSGVAKLDRPITSSQVLVSGNHQVPFERKRPCRHCGGSHFDFECSTRPKKTKAYILHAQDKDTEHSIDLDDDEYAFVQQMSQCHLIDPDVDELPSSPSTVDEDSENETRDR